MRSILLHIFDDDLKAKTQVALDLARAFDGHLTCLQAVPYEYGVPGDIYGAVVADLLPAIRESADALRERVEAQLAVEDVAWSWDYHDGTAQDHLLRQSSLNDIIVVGCHEPFRKGPSTLAEVLALRARTPIMLVPPKSNGLNYGGMAMVAWNGSPESGRALKAAVPLLAKARSVVLATVTEESPEGFDLPAVEGAEYLSRHDIACSMVELPREGRSVCEVLAEAARAREAAYLVMGAYGAPRLVEAVLGGVTREFFTRPPVPILTCH